MTEFATALLGGLLGIGATLGGVELTRRRQATQLERDLLVRVVGEALKAMQRYMREILSLAYGSHPPYHREVIDGVEHVFPRQNVRDDPSQDERFDHVISEWNSSMHQLLVTAPAEIVTLSRQIDTELDRLLDLAIDEQWSREAFRAERVEVGELVAQFVNVARRATGADKLDVENVWTWADPPELPPRQG